MSSETHTVEQEQLEASELEASRRSPFNTALQTGIWSGVLSLLLVMAYHLKGWIGMSTAFGLAILLFIILSLLAMRYHRQTEQGGYVSYGRCVGVALLTSIFAGLIGGACLVLLYTVDPSAYPQFLTDCSEWIERYKLNSNWIQFLAPDGITVYQPWRLFVLSVVLTPILGLLIGLIGGIFIRRSSVDTY